MPGAAALALDELWLRNGKLAALSEETRDALRQALPVGVEIANPLDLRDDASSEHYQRAVNVLLNSQDYDALLVIHSPSAAGAAPLLTIISFSPRSGRMWLRVSTAENSSWVSCTRSRPAR